MDHIMCKNFQRQFPCFFSLQYSCHHPEEDKLSVQIMSLPLTHAVNRIMQKFLEIPPLLLILLNFPLIPVCKESCSQETD